MTQSLSESQTPAPLPAAKTPRKRKPIALLLISLLLVGTGVGIWYFLGRSPGNSLHLSGRIEGYPTDIGAKVGGRVNAVAVREGDRVSKGQVIAQLDDDEVQAQLRGADARLNAALQQKTQAQFQVEVVLSQMQEAQLTVQQSVGDAQGKIYQADANVAAAEAQLSQTEAQLKQAISEAKLAGVNRDRFAQLVKDGAVTKQQFDQAQTTFETALAVVESRRSGVAAAQRQVNAAQGGFAQAQTTGFNPGIRNAQLTALSRQLGVARAQLAAAEAEVKNAQAAKQQIQAQLAYLTVPSPIDGVVLSRSVEPGQVVTTGKTLLTVIDPKNIYLRGFIPEGDVGRVQLGQTAKVYLDSNPSQPLEAKVAAIDTQASFTPENIYFREDRVKQVFGIKLNLTNPSGSAKPGMPADGEIVLDNRGAK